MLSKDDLAAAVRHNDERSDAGQPLEGILTSLGIDARAAAYVAEQRALRVALIFEGWTPQELAMMSHQINPRKVKLHSEMVTLIPTMAALWMDGLTAHARAVFDQPTGAIQ